MKVKGVAEVESLITSIKLKINCLNYIWKQHK